jgi:2-desacetyl-2-hydroxyethyl bacteriochlorophyllide A dehydrogenase
MPEWEIVSTRKGYVELLPFELEDPLDDELQVRVHVSAISSGTERAFILGLENTTQQYPLRTGYCSAGIVEKIGRRIQGFKVGERVAFWLGHRTAGNVRIKENMVVKIPDGVSFEEAAYIQLGAISLHGIRKARIELGEAVLVFGLGLVGQMALQLAKLSGGFPVIGIDRVESRLELARTLGADVTINTNDADWVNQLLIHTRGKGPEVVIESTGYPEGINYAFQAAAKYGRVVLLGSTRGTTTVNFYRDVHTKALTVYGAHFTGRLHNDITPGTWPGRDNAEVIAGLLQSGRFRIDPLIRDRVSKDEIAQIYERILSWNTDVMGSVIAWQ